ncbi:hypothetical protein BHE74_00021438 [Ensete ventricosum]|nr:hypothetical protein BHE74_00021438 [Ensete ventricosum]
MPSHNVYFILVFFFFFLTVTTSHEHALRGRDAHLLLSFKASADPCNAVLRSWEGHDPCSGSWIGVTCNRRRVVGLRLDDASLTGSVTPLFGLTRLRVLSLRRNVLTGSLPHLTTLNNPRLRRLSLSHNKLRGTLNVSLPSLASLRVEHNQFSGGVEGLRLPNVRDFNVSSNQLSGEITDLLSKFPASAFEGNQGLCGSHLPGCGEVSRLSDDTTAISPSPASLQSATDSSSSRSSTKVGFTALLAIGISDLLVIAVGLVVIVGMYLWLRKKLISSLNGAAASIRELEPDQLQREEKEKDRSLICFEGGEDLRLDCLLKASAEVLGKGLSGSTYRAVLEDGIIVAVKRLSAVQFPSHCKAFDRQMHLIGRVRHPRVVSLRAYCNAHEEKLLVYDFMPNGSLLSLLQRNSKFLRTAKGRLQPAIARSFDGCLSSCAGEGSGRTLDWMSRKQILMGAAEGLAFIHAFPARSPLVHANIKPSNILIDEQGNACIAEWGIMRFTSNLNQALPHYPSGCLSDGAMFTAGTTTRLGYRAPELVNGKEKPTQESDVYSFGMVLLEVVTDKEIDDAEGEGEVMGMVKIGMLCTAECPEERPKANQVVRMLSDFL